MGRPDGHTGNAVGGGPGRGRATQVGVPAREAIMHPSSIVATRATRTTTPTPSWPSRASAAGWTVALPGTASYPLRPSCFRAHVMVRSLCANPVLCITSSTRPRSGRCPWSLFVMDSDRHGERFDGHSTFTSTPSDEGLRFGFAGRVPPGKTLKSDRPMSG